LREVEAKARVESGRQGKDERGEEKPQNEKGTELLWWSLKSIDRRAREER